MCLRYKQTFELVTGRTPFEGWCDARGMIPQFKKVLGNLPEAWIQDALESKVLEEVPDGSSPMSVFVFPAELTGWTGADSSAVNFKPLEEELREKYISGRDADIINLSESYLEVLARYLGKLLVLDPNHRITAQELLDDAWVAEESCVVENDDTSEVEEQAADQLSALVLEKEENVVVDKGAAEVE